MNFKIGKFQIHNGFLFCDDIIVRAQSFISIRTKVEYWNGESTFTWTSWANSIQFGRRHVFHVSLLLGIGLRDGIYNFDAIVINASHLCSSLRFGLSITYGNEKFNKNTQFYQIYKKNIIYVQIIQKHEKS